MANHTTNGHTNGHTNGTFSGVSFVDLPKTNNFTSNLPADAAFPTPADSHKAPRQKLGPRLVQNALFTYVRPVPTEDPELLAVSPVALRDLGLAQTEADSQELRDIVSGRKIFWDEEKEEGIYPWAQCYGGFQFGQWAGQLGDGRAISLFETVNPATNKRYEVQLKGAGKTPYSRFADGKAVLRSSIREFVVSESLNALKIPTTRALSLVLCNNGENTVARERMEPGAIVCRFAESWLRLGTFDLMRSRGARDLIRTTATYIAEQVFPGWESLPAAIPKDSDKQTFVDPARGVARDELQGPEGEEQNRFARLYREIVRRNAKTVAAWQAYGFMNGVLNTDNTSVFGLSLDFGPFAFMDNFDPTYTPNHDDQLQRYSYRSQPTVIRWNLVRLGEAFGELIGSGDRVDDTTFVEKGVEEDFAETLIKRAESIIEQAGEEYTTVFLTEYRRLFGQRLGLKTSKDSDFDKLFSDLLDTMEALELDFNHFFRRLSSVKLSDVKDKESRQATAQRFFHKEGVTGLNESEESGRDKVGVWLEQWSDRIKEDWGESSDADAEREKAMKKVNPNFVPRGWVLDEVIDRVQNKKDRKILDGIMKMALHPFEDSWGWDESEEQRLCGDVPRYKRSIQCSCSS